MDIKILKTNSASRDELLKLIAQDALKNEFITNEKKLVDAFIKRENEGTTGFEDGIAMPHARISSIKKTVIYVARNSNELDWQSLDGKPTTCAIALLVAGDDKAGNAHMEILSKVASALMDEEKRSIFKAGTLTKIKSLFKEDKKKEVKVNASDRYDFVCISTCPTGVAHTNMAAEAMEKYAKANNLNIKVERQGAQGPVNILTEEDIKKADYVVVAASRPADGLDRFDGKKVYRCKVAEPIKSSKKVFDDAREKAKVQSISRKTTAKKAMGAGGAKPMEALMNGISYMIPFVVCGGILIALSLGIGGHIVKGKAGLQLDPGSFWAALCSVGGAGFALMVPILAAFIASAIAGRAAIAPAMIVAFVVGNASDTFFDYSALEFGMKNAKLGFLGSIAVGFFVGYLVKSWQRTIGVKMPKMLKPIEPIILIPIIITVVSWLAFSFVIYLPVYYLSQGLNTGVKNLIDRNLFFIAALILGAMIGFDMGGPVNKIAFLFAGGMIANGKPEVMGAVAAAIAVPPLGMGLAVFMAKLFRNKKFDTDDEGNAISALFMSVVGITEGAIPFAVKYPKQAIIANIVGSAIGAAVASLFVIGDAAQHGGPIVYLVGAIGKVVDGQVITDYVYGLLYLGSILVGGFTTAIVMNVLMKHDLFKPIRILFRKLRKKEVIKK